jgi:hypothetical protein
MSVELFWSRFDPGLARRNAHVSSAPDLHHGSHRVNTRGLWRRVLVHPADLRDADMASWRLAAAYESCTGLQHIVTVGCDTDH